MSEWNRTSLKPPAAPPRPPESHGGRERGARMCRMWSNVQKRAPARRTGGVAAERVGTFGRKAMGRLARPARQPVEK